MKKETEKKESTTTQAGLFAFSEAKAKTPPTVQCYLVYYDPMGRGTNQIQFVLSGAFDNIYQQYFDFNKHDEVVFHNPWLGV